MPKKKESEVDYTTYSYAQLEEEVQKTISKMNDSELPLDEAALLYEQGKKILSEMEKRLSELEKSVSDTIVKD